MRFEKTLKAFRSRFPQRGLFVLRRGDFIRKVVNEYGVPSAAAAYVVSAVGSTTDVIYIGKAGTVRKDGTWKTQLLAGRLCNTQQNMSRQALFQKMLTQNRARELRFEWFVTKSDRVILPAFAEAELLQAYFDDTGKLPRYNECA